MPILAHCGVGGKGPEMRNLHLTHPTLNQKMTGLPPRPTNKKGSFENYMKNAIQRA